MSHAGGDDDGGVPAGLLAAANLLTLRDRGASSSNDDPTTAQQHHHHQRHHQQHDDDDDDDQHQYEDGDGLRRDLAAEPVVAADDVPIGIGPFGDRYRYVRRDGDGSTTTNTAAGGDDDADLAAQQQQQQQQHQQQQQQQHIANPELSAIELAEIGGAADAVHGTLTISPPSPPGSGGYSDKKLLRDGSRSGPPTAESGDADALAQDNGFGAPDDDELAAQGGVVLARRGGGGGGDGSDGSHPHDDDAGSGVTDPPMDAMARGEWSFSRCCSLKACMAYPGRTMCAVGCILFSVVVILALAFATPADSTERWSFADLNATYWEMRDVLSAGGGAADHDGWDRQHSYFERMDSAGIAFDEYRDPLQAALMRADPQEDHSYSLQWLVIAARLPGFGSGGTSSSTTDYPLGASKVGGLPHFPKAWNGAPPGPALASDAFFFAQINLRDVIVHDLRGTLPLRGMLYFYQYGRDVSDDDRTVFWYDGDVVTDPAATLTRDNPDPCTPPQCILLPRNLWTLTANCNVPSWTPAASENCPRDTAQFPDSDLAASYGLDLLGTVTPSEPQAARMSALNGTNVMHPVTYDLRARARLLTAHGTNGAFGVSGAVQYTSYVAWGDVLGRQFQRAIALNVRRN